MLRTAHGAVLPAVLSYISERRTVCRNSRVLRSTANSVTLIVVRRVSSHAQTSDGFGSPCSVKLMCLWLLCAAAWC